MVGLKDYILDVLFPRLCLGCGTFVSDGKKSCLCSACLSGMKIKNDFACAFCGSQVTAGLTCPFCRSGHFLDRLWVATSYENPLIEKTLKTMKYKFIRTLADDIAVLMAKYLERRFSSGFDINRDSTVIVPVPLHRRRLNWRGFNQSEIIGRQIGSHFGLNFREDVLRRKCNRAPQAQITDRNSRIANMKGVFECQRPELVRGKTIFLVDDIATTGSTLDDCARVLKGAGAKEVIGFVFAHPHTKQATI